MVCSTASSLCMCCCMLCCTKCCWVCRLCLPSQSAHFCQAASVPLYIVQVVTQTLWEAAVAAYQHSSNIHGMYQAWLWRQKHGHGWNWAPSQECYLFMVHAVTLLHHQPMEGQDFCNWVLLCCPNHSLHCTTTSPMATDNLYVA